MVSECNMNEKLEFKRYQKVVQWIGSYKKDLAVRLEESKTLFGKNVVITDPHVHSSYSDGSARIEINYEAARQAGLDFMYATDHQTIEQQEVTSNLESASWGQEPGIQLHHIGLLENTKTFEPVKESLAGDYKDASDMAPFVWIPHPAGWYPKKSYTEEQFDALWTLPDQFAMEVMNGAHKIFRAYDQFDEAAIALWDRLLGSGKRVIGLAGSDAHAPEGIGCVWTGVLGTEGANSESIIKSLKEGRCFASEASLLDFTLQNRPMGSEVKVRKGEDMILNYRIADAYGLQNIWIKSEGKVIEAMQPAGKTLVEGDVRLKCPKHNTYYRIESQATDDRRAFSNPVYVNIQESSA